MNNLFGHEEAEAQLLHDLESGRLAHGWLISGPRGIGKATLAYRFAAALLTSPSPRGEEGWEVGESDNTTARIAAGSHADLLVVKPLFDAKKEEFAREISAEQAREISQFLALTPGESAWRVVIVDAVDAMGTHAANAILKIVEEPPPQAVLLLISHNPGQLLPTIRSRCRNLRLKPLTAAQFEAVMAQTAPNIEREQLPALGSLSLYSPGIAIELQEQGALELYQQILELLSLIPELNMTKIHAFAEKIGSGQVHNNWRFFTQLMLFLLRRIANQSADIEEDPVTEEEGGILHRLAALHPAGLWAVKWQQAAEQFSLAERLHLDYKQVIIAFFHSIASKEGLQIGAAA